MTNNILVWYYRYWINIWTSRKLEKSHVKKLRKFWLNPMKKSLNKALLLYLLWMQLNLS